LDTDKPNLQKRIESEGWGAKFLTRQNKEGHRGEHFYQPKWISTHYTVLDLKHLSIAPDNHKIKQFILIRL